MSKKKINKPFVPSAPPALSKMPETTIKTTVEAPKDKPHVISGKVIVKLIRNATGRYRLANREGDDIEVTAELAKDMISEGYAEMIK